RNERLDYFGSRDHLERPRGPLSASNPPRYSDHLRSDPRVDAFVRAFKTAIVSVFSDLHSTEARLESVLLADMLFHLPHLLHRKDRSSMRFGVEARVPYLDPRLIEAAFRTPLRERVAVEGKGALRQFASTLLPPNIAARPKQGFQLPYKKLMAGCV